MRLFPAVCSISLSEDVNSHVVHQVWPVQRVVCCLSWLAVLKNHTLLLNLSYPSWASESFIVVHPELGLQQRYAIMYDQASILKIFDIDFTSV